MQFALGGRDADDQAGDNDIGAQQKQKDGALVAPEMGVQILDLILVTRKDQGGRDVEQACDHQAQHQKGQIERGGAEDDPGLEPEGGHIQCGEHHQQRRQQAEARPWITVQRPREPAQQFRHRQAQDQPIEAEEKFERAHIAPSA